MKTKAPFSSIAPLLRTFLFYISTIVILMVTSRITKSLNVNYKEGINILLAVGLTFCLVILFTKWERLKLMDIGISVKKNPSIGFIRGYIIGLILVALHLSTLNALGLIKLEINPAFSFTSLCFHFLLFLLVAVREELAFRSYFIRTLHYRYSFLFALIIVTLVFILEHIVSGLSIKMSIIGSGFGGILFGVAALRSRSISLPIGLHAAWNFGQWFTGFKDQSTGFLNPAALSENNLYVENMSLVLFSLIMILGTLLIIYLTRKLEQ
ncbi:Abortive infection protein [Pseudopedobacter saltans DSM 12145]|uniref:Abortive infection protein n=1 Tax=Pseudopedobacter saltans (strain ATCC 51119 / DSM 12145 / JCM 21818 / CCUG 39354 / LMG 10337 / NBRC 100064 / NCIMB 13643) TaxID=762903 RepID=F0SCU5_PSESL|nr:type II CAAX endopeptidase family protein [Pseudopedobacter saltans]ADY50684.1 Abortive infection protein [Pseudopedobacter saltans DSM 12145]